MDALVALVEAGQPADPVTRDWFAENVLLDPNFDPDGLIVAVDGGEPVGFVHAVSGWRGAGSIPVDPDGGWLTIGTVHPAARRRGIGTKLVERALAFLRDGGAHWANWSAYPPAYFLPGLDAERYPDGLRLLERLGFQTLYRPVAMDLGLATYTMPEPVAQLLAARQTEGFTVGPARLDDLPDVMAFAAEQLAPDWGEAIRQSVLRYGRPGRVVVCRDPDGVMVGFATYGAYRGLPERFGPFGVAPVRRGLGLGKVLLHVTLARMRAEGAHSAWFLWTGPETPAGRLYLDAGFTITRTFTVLRAPLSE
ncbi:N-acetyltransferase [Jiangella asiatica]|uniref:N-acetyltransferase n=1 Tax=Jiangella asiatica TaxID=2530372 RepID=A0A4R5D9D8_9ACTN|nr:N-acetyltransferase [Jiangella asiatica]